MSRCIKWCVVDIQGNKLSYLQTNFFNRYTNMQTNFATHYNSPDLLPNKRRLQPSQTLQRSDIVPLSDIEEEWNSLI